MSLRGEDALILAQDYVDETLKGEGALKGKDGKDGVSPIISVKTSTEDTYKLDITDKNGTITTPNLVGKQGLRGEVGETGADGVTFTPSIDENGVLSFTNNGGLANPEPIKVLGKDGKDGVQISDNETVEDKTWSSSKIASKIPTTLPANGGNADTVNNHTVKSDVPENAKFTDTIYDDTELNAKLNAKVGKTDIATTIDGKSTDTQVPSAKAVWNKSKNKIQRLLDGVDIIVYADSISHEMVTDTVRIMNATNSPYGVDNVNNDFHYTIYNVNDDKYKRILAYDIRKNDMHMIIKNNNIWGTWAKLAAMDKVESKYEEATLDTPVDWNTLNTKARYYFSGGATMTNAPIQVPFGELVVETAGNGSVCRVQKFFSFDGRLYMRRWTGSIWNEWYRFDGISI